MTRSIAELRARFEAVAGPRPPPSLETLFTSPDYFGVETATALQRAVCRLADGVSLGALAKHPDVIEAFGGADAVAALASLGIPELLLLLGAIRSGKSEIAAALCIRLSQRVDVSGLGPGERPRVSCLSIRKDLAESVRNHLMGVLLTKPAAKAWLLCDPTSEMLLLKHPTGRAIEVKIVAGAAAGATLMSRWCAGAIFDEAPQMVGAGEGVINLDDMRSAIRGRVLPGGMAAELGSPWAPFGPVYESVTESFGKPTKAMVIVRATGPQMHPQWWTPERCAELQETDPRAYRTNVLAQFVDPEEAFLPSVTLDACSRVELVEARRDRHEYVAAMDPATRGNAWTLAIGTRRGGKRIVVKARQWVGSTAKPLDPDEVLKQVAGECTAYGVDTIETDQWSGDALRALARRHGLTLVIWPWTSTEKTEVYLDFASRAARKEIELPPDPVVRADLLMVRRRVTQAGLAIVEPETKDGRHCDFAPAIVRVTRRHCMEAKDALPTPAQQAAREEAEVLKRVEDRWATKPRVPTWRRGYGG